MALAGEGERKKAESEEFLAMKVKQNSSFY